MQAQQASWRLREQKRKEEAEAAARRRAVEKNEISFPSLGNVGWGEEPKKESEAAQRWSAGDVVRSSTAPASASASAASAGAGGSRSRQTSASAPAPAGGVHARISAQVRRTQSATTNWRGDDCEGSDYEGDGLDKDNEDGGWTEVSKTKTKARTKSKLTAAPPASHAPDDYGDDDEYY